ncbi:hypothetical protein PZ938_05540 [Luteipulveratus sp. YIM 133132]|uniref:hypothetical protein n=1 Tax=Luteipulveratus flavus TaxID=3031728 RepID=UPI0023B00140|nr:hypothetical protein [Luteipulveratus sp. YIM 133132]MDE9365064.1 hypothetical protein [Luteipulveratus sp. YIM 133132]
MTSLTGVVSELLILGVTLLGAVLLPALTRWRARLGRPVALPTYVRHPAGPGPARTGHGGAARSQQARLLVDGDTARVVGSRLHLVLPVALWRSAAVRRRVDVDQVGPTTQVRLHDEDGRQWLVGVPAGWQAALARRRGRRLLTWTRWRLAGPRWMGLVAGLILIVPAALHLVWWTGHDEQATVVRVVNDRTQLRCEVRWTDEHGGHSSIDDCEVGLVRPGDRLEVRALGWPWRGRTMSDQTIVAVSAITILPAFVLGLLARVFGWWRVRRRPTALVSAGPAPHPLEPVIDPSALSTTDLWLRCAEEEGWYDDPTSPPPDPRRRAPRVALAQPWWLIGLPLVVLGLVELHRAWPALVVGLLVWAAGGAAAARTLARMGAAQRSVETQEWSYLLTRTLRDSWVMLLMRDSRPQWQLDLGRGAHPDVAGTCTVRGPLRPRGRVQPEIGGTAWLPVGRVQRVDAEAERELRASLADRVTVEPARP